jgi:CBS domain-containing membrane protein
LRVFLLAPQAVRWHEARYAWFEEAPMTRALTVADLMTSNVVSLHQENTVGRAKAEMVYAEIRHIPVVDAHNLVVGIVSNHDLQRAAGRWKEPKRISEIMTHRAVTVRASTPAHQAAAIMLEQKLRSLPVVDGKGLLVGIITETDFLSVAHQALRGLAPHERAQS